MCPATRDDHETLISSKTKIEIADAAHTEVMRGTWTLFGLFLIACSAHSEFGDDTATDSGERALDGTADGYTTPPNDATANFGDSSADSPSGDGGVVTTVYANTDDTLYSLDPQTNAITLIGSFAGTSDASTDSTITDIAVDAAGDVYANTESVIYRATLPNNPPGTVSLTKIASIALAQNQRFYALAFAPAGALDTNEVLVGGDGNGELYSIDTTNGSTRDLGSFGPDPSTSGNDFALSGDLVFYNGANNTPTGLATVRSCKAKTTTCTTSDDYLVGVNMTALANAYKTSTPAASLLSGIYGGSKGSNGPGTGYGDLFGLGAWEGSVFAFARQTSANKTPLLLSINTTTGQGTVVSSAFNFSNGWSGAGVTTSVTITVPPPPVN